MAERRIDVMQSCLSTLKYDPGPHDGIDGPRTRAALEQFCQREHVPCDWPHGKAAINQLAYAAAAKVVPHGIWNQLGLGF
jgi:peptidoglycan hydrolase-like protein with peptidoglycan-binding domain